MADGGFAIACVVILCFVLFILYGRSSSGKTTLRKVYGNPNPLKTVRRPVTTRKPHGMGKTKTAAPQTSRAKTTSRTKSR